MTDTTNDLLNETEKTALRAASEAFLLIRMLTANPMSPEVRQIIHEVADAFHNVPEQCAGSAGQRRANAFLIEAGIRDAIKTFNKHGLASRHLPTQI